MGFLGLLPSFADEKTGPERGNDLSRINSDYLFLGTLYISFQKVWYTYHPLHRGRIISRMWLN